jgi:hypothetical protein
MPAVLFAVEFAGDGTQQLISAMAILRLKLNIRTLAATRAKELKCRDRVFMLFKPPTW